MKCFKAVFAKTSHHHYHYHHHHHCGWPLSLWITCAILAHILAFFLAFLLLFNSFPFLFHSLASTIQY